MKSPPTILDRIPRKARVIIDLVVAAALLLACWYAAGCPVPGEEAKFRRAERSAMVGPSVLLDRLFIQSDWPYTQYNLLRIGDGGDGIVFYMMRTGAGASSQYDKLEYRRKTDGILLTPLPTWYMANYPPEGTLYVPLLLFVDDTAAVKATVRLTLDDGSEYEMTQVRDWHNHVLLSDSELEGYRTGSVRDGFFLFEQAVTEQEWQEGFLRLMGSDYQAPAVIELYDQSNQLIRTVDYTIRSRAGD